VTVLLVGFDAPDADALPYEACLEVEASDSIVDSQRHLLGIGRRLVVLGRLTGAGGLLVSALVVDGAERPSRQGERRP
jgi:hypothetical protein